LPLFKLGTNNSITAMHQGTCN